jgi:SMI1 / KNR4 family (SUKH-1)
MEANNNLWALLEERFKSYPEDFGGKCELKEIEEAQKEIGLNFNNSYKKFLSKYGSVTLSGYIIYGLIPLPEMGRAHNDVIKKTKFFKETQKWPDIENWYIISDDGRGNPIGIDHEGRVWLSDHDSGFEQIKLADSFEEFLYKLHTETLYE